MKKTINLILAFIIVSILPVICLADSIDSNTFYYKNGKEITIYNDNLSYSEKKEIADYIAYNETTSSPNENELPVSSSLICTLFGHDLDTTYVSEVNHNVYSESPKCVRNTYACEYCKRSSCDYINTTLLTSVRISTCHG